MFNIGFGEMVMLAAIALIFIGPKELPGIARTVGRLLNELKRTGDELTGSFLKTRDTFQTHVRDVEKKLSETVVDLDKSPTKTDAPSEELKKGSS